MSKTQYYRLTGKIEYAHHLFVPDEYPAGSGQKRWQCNFYPDDRDALKLTGCQLRYDRKTDSYVRPRRDVRKKIKEEIVEFEPPRVTNADGTPFEDRIGNGTHAEITISVFPTGMGNGHRLEAVRILDLVRYDPVVDEGEEAPTSKVETKVETTPVVKPKVKPKLPF